MVDVTTPDPTPAAAPRAPRWRRIVTAVLVVLLCVLTPLAVVGVWLRNTVVDSDQWVETMAPLAHDPAVQAAITNRISTAIIDNSDFESRITDLLPDRAKPIAPFVDAGAERLIRTTTQRLVESDQFAALWSTVNRRAHDRVINVLEGKGTDRISTEDGKVEVELGPVVQTVAEKLQGLGVDVDASNLNPRITLLESSSLKSAQTGLRLLDTAAWVLPFVLLVLLVGALACSTDRRRTVLRAALGIALAVGVTLVALNVGRNPYLGALPERVNTDAAANLYDQILSFLRTSLRTVFALALVVALVAWLAGPGAFAIRVRTVFRSGTERVPVSGHVPAAAQFAHRFHTALRVLVVGLGLVILVVWQHPTPLTVLLVLVIVAVLFAVVEVLARAGAPAEGVSETPAPTV